jgi:hypothetical protein
LLLEESGQTDPVEVPEYPSTAGGDTPAAPFKGENETRKIQLEYIIPMHTWPRRTLQRLAVTIGGNGTVQNCKFWNSRGEISPILWSSESTEVIFTHFCGEVTLEHIGEARNASTDLNSAEAG